MKRLGVLFIAFAFAACMEHQEVAVEPTTAAVTSHQTFATIRLRVEPTDDPLAPATLVAVRRSLSQESFRIVNGTEPWNVDMLVRVQSFDDGGTPRTVVSIDSRVGRRFMMPVSVEFMKGVGVDETSIVELCSRWRRRFHRGAQAGEHAGAHHREVGSARTLEGSGAP
jgi:hypothetical protein